MLVLDPLVRVSQADQGQLLFVISLGVPGRSYKAIHVLLLPDWTWKYM